MGPRKVRKMKLPIVVTNSRVPKLLSWVVNAYAITLWPFVFIRDEGDEKTINHERIHLAQQKELFLLGFYILYVAFWFIGLFKYRSTQVAYYEIPFEREAYLNDDDLSYLSSRKRHAWTEYISIS